MTFSRTKGSSRAQQPVIQNNPTDPDVVSFKDKKSTKEVARKIGYLQTLVEQLKQTQILNLVKVFGKAFGYKIMMGVYYFKGSSGKVNPGTSTNNDTDSFDQYDQ